MKIIILLLSIVLFDKGCSESKINQDNMTIEYSTLSRGSYKLIKVNKKSISVINKRNAKPIIKTCSEKDWDKLIDVLKTIDIENLPNLKAPSEKRLFDGAAIANLLITYNSNTYKSASFDHGNPPKEIESIVKEILSISENIE
jgi:hypothetical protein